MMCICWYNVPMNETRSNIHMYVRTYVFYVVFLLELTAGMFSVINKCQSEMRRVKDEAAAVKT